MHDPSAKGKVRQSTFPWRGLMNVTVLILLILGMLALFVFDPVFKLGNLAELGGWDAF